MNITIEPCALRGTVQVPASKSTAHRALIAAALSDGPTVVRLSALNDDIEATARALKALGAKVERGAGCLNVSPVPAAPEHPIEIDCGESGSTLRFLLPVACALGAAARFSGRGRLPERPMAALTDALRAHGASIDADALPINAAGPVYGGTWALPGDVSSQYVTGLLLALPLLQEDSAVRLTSPLQSASYVEMTVRAMQDFGVRAIPTGGGWDVPGGQAYRSPGEYAVEGDWSAAAFWHAANAMGAQIAVEGTDPDSPQGDRAVLRLLGQTEIDARDVPDLVPALAAAAAALPRRTLITGAARLRLKESDRLAASQDMISALGGRCTETPDGLMIDGGGPLHGGIIDGRNDHRVVMAAAILATRASGPVTISDAEAVSKSYPNFFQDFRALGGIAHG